MSDDEVEGLVVYTAAEILDIGLKLVGYKEKRLQRCGQAVNRYRFRVHFGSDSCVLATIFTDLQTTSIEEAFLPRKARNIKQFLMAMHLLKIYPTEIEREAIFDISPSYGRDQCWFYIKKVRALKAQKIVWDDGGDDIWILTVDGIHTWTNEYVHPIWSQDSKAFSFKYHHAGLCYEIGISLTKDQVVWLNGSFKAGANDKTNFIRKDGLRDKLKALGKKGIGDAGYVGYPDVLSTNNNAHDDKEVKKFKSRALLRHETFNGLIKNFGCLQGRFRHKQARFEDCFEAIVVICQYQIESTRPLFDILLENMGGV